MGGGGSQPAHTTQVTKNEPWEGAKPYYEDMYRRASEALAATNKNPYTGEFIATDASAGGSIGKGLDLLQGNVDSGMLGKGATDFANMAAATARGDYLDPAKNPFLAATAQAAVRPIQEQLTGTILPSIRDQSIAQGAYGGARQDVQENQATQLFSREALDATNRLYNANYQAERDRQVNSGQMITQAGDLLRMPGLEMMRIGDVRKQQAQEVIDNNYQKFMEQKNAPWYGLGEMSQILGTGGFRTTTGTGPAAPKQDSTGQWVQTAMGAVAALAPLLLLSDETEKTDIKKVGTFKGVPIFSYRYKGDPKTYPKIVGPMAQDIEKVEPDAVFEVAGKKAVLADVLQEYTPEPGNPFLKEAA